MTYSRNIEAAILTITDFDLRYTLDQMVGSAEQNAVDTVGSYSGDEYEAMFSATLEECRGKDYVDADQVHLGDLADAWLEAYPEAAKLSDIASVASIITTQRAEIAILKAQLS